MGAGESPEDQARSLPVVAVFRREYTRPTETFIRAQVGALSGYAPVVVCRSQRDGSAPAPGSAIVDVLSYEDAGLERGLDRLAYRYLKRSNSREDRWYARAIVDASAGVVHSHFGTDGGYILPATRIAKVPLVVSWYGYDVSQFPRWLGGMGKVWLRPVLREARLHLAMTPQMAQSLLDLGAPASRVRLHHFGVDSSFWSAAQSVTPVPKRVLMVASFVEKKGHLDLIRAFAEVCEHDAECTLRLVGSGPLEGAVHSLVRELGLSARVSFAGFVPHGDALLAEYRAASVYVHPSRTAVNGDQEGLPTTVLEAMAVGLPVVSTTHAGIPHAVTADNGLLVGEGDCHALGQALLQVLGDPGLRTSMGAAGRSRVIADFDLSTQTRRLESLYDEARDVDGRKGAW